MGGKLIATGLAWLCLAPKLVGVGMPTMAVLLPSPVKYVAWGLMYFNLLICDLTIVFSVYTTTQLTPGLFGIWKYFYFFNWAIGNHLNVVLAHVGKILKYFG